MARNLTSVQTACSSCGFPRSTSSESPEYTLCTFPESMRKHRSASSGPDGLPSAAPSTSTTVSTPSTHRGDSVLNRASTASTLRRASPATMSGIGAPGG